MSATLSCPEAARLFLATPHPLTYEEVPTPERLPTRLATPLHTPQEQALHEACIGVVCNKAHAPSEALVVLIAQAAHWQHCPPDTWEMNDTTLPIAEGKHSDPIALTYALTMLAHRGDMPPRPRLLAVLAQMQEAMAISIDADSYSLSTRADTPARLRVLDMAPTEATHPWLRDWLAHQLHSVAFPYGGLHRANVWERITLIAVRFATLRLALACAPEMKAVDVVQPLARLVDHQADHAPALQLARDAGWSTPERLIGLVSAASG
jgi:hypothetical protein